MSSDEISISKLTKPNAQIARGILDRGTDESAAVDLSTIG
jgi:hypothetical protein